jgi:hypothetical protein
MKVWVIYHLEPDNETSIVKVVSSEAAAEEYVKEYQKDNVNRDWYARQYADYEDFEVDDISDNQGRLPI